MHLSAARKQELLIIAIIIALASFSILFRVNFPGINQGDTQSYVDTAHLFEGQTIDNITYHRVLKPLVPYSMLLISAITGMSLNEALLTQSIIFYFALALVMFYFLKIFFENKYLALTGTILYITAYPMLRSGISMLTDTGAWFFFVISIIAIYKYYLKPTNKNFLVSVALVALGFLWKEYHALAATLFGLIILFHPKLKLKDKITKEIIYVVLFLILFLPWQLYAYYKFGYSYFDLYTSPARYSSIIVVYFILKSLFATMLLGWALVPIGLRNWKKMSLDQRFILRNLLLVSLLVFVWGSIDSRLYFIGVVPLIILAVRGLEYLYKRLQPILPMILYILIIAGNFVWLAVNNNFRHLLGTLPY
jgi:hypothetical protein